MRVFEVAVCAKSAQYTENKSVIRNKAIDERQIVEKK